MARHRSTTSAPQRFDFSVVRDLRRRADLTIAEVADRSGISAAVISRLERNAANVEMATLFRLSRALGVTVTDLVALAERQPVRRERTRTHEAGQFHFEEVAFGNCRCLYGTAPRGARVSRPEIHGDDREVCWVRRGRIRLKLPDEQHELVAGEAIQFDALLEHTYEALEPSELVILHLRKSNRVGA